MFFSSFQCVCVCEHAYLETVVWVCGHAYLDAVRGLEYVFQQAVDGV